MLRGVTPPDAPSYTLNLPPNSKELFTKNITIARIEHPAVASHPIRTARSSGPSYSSGKSSASRQASVAHKSNGKSRSSAKASKKAASRTYAKQEKPTKSTPVKAGAAPVVQASLFGTPSLAAKPSDAKKTKVALIGTAQEPDQGRGRQKQEIGRDPVGEKERQLLQECQQSQEKQLVQQKFQGQVFPVQVQAGPHGFRSPVTLPGFGPSPSRKFFYRPPCFSQDNG